MKTLFNNYLNTFRGLSREVWWLALITLINRAGTMVVPFLSLYLNKDLGFSLVNIGWILSIYGLGATVGSLIGGKLADKIGFYRVMVFSLFGTGIMFILLQYLTTLLTFSLGIFVVMVVADSFRPAMFVAMSAYSKPENKTRSVTLIRLAINLGFSAGPAVGGIIITTIGYSGLFWIDGITCILATLLLINVLHPKKAKQLDNVTNENPKSILKDKPFWLFFIAMTLFGIIFLQYFSTMPLYYKDIHFLSELEIGLLLGMNGLIIFILEMPLIKWLENATYSKVALMVFGSLLVGGSFIVLIITNWVGVLILGMLLMTIGEMIVFPFSNAFVMERGKRGKLGEYMALYTVSFSISHVFGHNAGMRMVDKLGYDFTWIIISILSIICVITLVFLKKSLISEKLKK
ncbi:MDR family MFS transporter [Pontimicrobium aquaticum]|uniref:MFS transporter n=1 Tax=Pontimicrobium aquaticum TaxID=2565367 RepID=A0A4U0F3I3_9FLAO|nr:MFS transporter [Pontimicrobium aquaticum]TJY37302.1 MFS transporter [Pontimicrobium aquaticum]